MEPFNHTTNKQGCVSCRNEKFSQEYRNDLETFLRKSIERHGYFYDYSKVNYISNKMDIEIVCPIHGSFWQGAGNHYSGGQGCPKCGLIKIGNARRDTRKSFIEKAKVKHGDRYDFSQVVYLNCNTEVKIICSIHGEFWQKPMFTVRGCGCQSCAKTESKWEGELKEYVRSLGVVADKSKSLINPWELDIYIVENKLAIEANGLWWHSEYNDTISSTYHLNKTEMCNDLGIQLLHIFEDEWHDKKDIVKSMVAHKLGKTLTKIAARKCEIRDVSNDDAKSFLLTNHVQGSLDNLDVNLGLYFADELVSIMCLGKPRYDTNHQYEIYRLCSKTFVSVIGSAGKLLNHFITANNPDSIVSYANKRFSKGGVYENLGMVYLGDTKNMNYWYVHKDRIVRQGRTAFQKHLLKDKLKKYDESLTEIENMKMNNYYRIWDCGQMIYSWKRPA